MNDFRDLKVGDKVDLTGLERCTGFFKQHFGLMFQKPRTILFPFGKSMIVNVHTVFVLGTINVYVLDSEGRVIDLRKGLKPFHYIVSEKPGWYLLETPV